MTTGNVIKLKFKRLVKSKVWWQIIARKGQAVLLWGQSSIIWTHAQRRFSTNTHQILGKHRRESRGGGGSEALLGIQKSLSFFREKLEVAFFAVFSHSESSRGRRHIGPWYTGPAKMATQHPKCTRTLSGKIRTLFKESSQLTFFFKKFL